MEFKTQAEITADSGSKNFTGKDGTTITYRKIGIREPGEADSLYVSCPVKFGEFKKGVLHDITLIADNKTGKLKLKEAVAIN